MVAIISALDVMIATPKNKISAACVKASRFDVYSCRILSFCRCIFAPKHFHESHVEIKEKAFANQIDAIAYKTAMARNRFSNTFSRTLTSHLVMTQLIVAVHKLHHIQEHTFLVCTFIVYPVLMYIFCKVVLCSQVDLLHPRVWLCVRVWLVYFGFFCFCFFEFECASVKE